MPDIIAATNSGNYEITVASKALIKAGQIVRPLVKGRKVFVVTDRNVAGHYLAYLTASLEKSGFDVRYHILPPGEETKCSDRLIELYMKFNQAGITRSDLIIAFGGGVVGDITGFAASTYLRGVRVVQIPTTLLAQVDSSIGGKTAINMPFGKNTVGSFYQPAAVIADPDVLQTLPDEEFSAGMAEVIKSGCIKDKELFRRIEDGTADTAWMIEKCIRIKTAVVAADERDTGERMLLNFGHTVGHGIEKATGYTRYTHGQAVAVGMVIAAKFGEKIGITTPGTSQRIADVLRKYDLPISTDTLADEIISAMRSDKKTFSDTVYFVLLKEIGDSVLYPIPSNSLADMFAEVLGQ